MCYRGMKVSDFLKVISVFFVVIGVVPSVAADSEDKSPRQRLCDIYKHHYDGANKEMASILAEGTGDDSAHRETNRQLKILNERVLQLIVIFQMQAHECSIPKMLSYSTNQGYDCQFERMKGNFDMCDQYLQGFIKQFLEQYDDSYSEIEGLEHFR